MPPSCAHNGVKPTNNGTKPRAGKVPYIFKIQGGDGATRADYLDKDGRAHLLNDFCKNNAIKTSNLIHVGGPLVNLGTYFMDDFTARACEDDLLSGSAQTVR